MYAVRFLVEALGCGYEAVHMVILGLQEAVSPSKRLVSAIILGIIIIIYIFLCRHRS